MIHVHESLRDLTPRDWTLLAASAFALGGMAAGGPIIVTRNLAAVLVFDVGPEGVQEPIVIASVGVGTFVSGAAVWWSVVEQPRTASTYRGVAVGIITVILAQVSSLLVIQLLVFVPRLLRVPGLGTSVGGSVGPVLVLAVSSVSFVLGATVLSLILYGVLLFPVGIVIGLGLARLRRPTIGENAPDRTSDDESE